jgi:hypothetical protein
VDRLPGDGLQHIARLGNSRQVNFGLDFARQGARCRSGGSGSSLRSSLSLPTEVLPDLLGLVRLDGAGVRLLVGDADLGQVVENFLALHFQLPRQIVDANLFHPACVLPNCPSSLHLNLTVIGL